MITKKFIFVLLACSARMLLAGEISLITLPVERWPEFRELRLRAVAEVPHAIGGSTADELARPDSFYIDLVRGAQTGSDGWLIFAEHEGKLVGVVGAICRMKHLSVMRHAVDLVSMYVVPEFRNSGVGEQLVNDIIRQLTESQQVRYVRLFVTETQKSAIRLYEKCGFVMCGKITAGVLVDGVEYDQYLMERKVK